MILCSILTVAIAIVFAFQMDREPSHDGAPSIMLFLQFSLALIVTMAIWLVYFAVT